MRKISKRTLIGISAISMSVLVSEMIKNNEDISAVSFKDDYLSGRNQEGMEEDAPEEIILFSFDELLTQLKNDIESYRQNKDIQYLNNAIDTFGKIPKITESLNDDMVAKSKELDTIFNSIRQYCYNLDSISEQEAYIKMFAEKIFLGWKYNKDITHYKDKFLIEGLVKYNEGKLVNIQDRLNYLEYVAFFYIQNGDPYPEHESIPEITMPESPLPDTDQGNNNGSNNGSNNGNNNNNNNNNNNSGNNNKPNTDNNISNNVNDSYTTITKFKRSGKKCYKVEETYRNGKQIKTNRVLAKKSDYVHCSIYDYVDFGSNTLKPVIEIDKDYLYNNQNKESEYTVYYTTNKSDESPYYYNTGVRANGFDKTLSYNQLSDILYQIAIKIDAQNVRSKEKSLFVIEGKPIVLDKNKNATYTQEFVENMLNGYHDLGIKIMKNSEYKSSLDKYNKSNNIKNYIDNIIIDGNSVVQKDTAWVDEDGVIKVSIQIIANLLGADAKFTNNTLTINKGKTQIIIENNKKEYFVNNDISSFIGSVYESEGQLISELADIPEKLGYNVDFNLDKNELEFTKIS